MKRIKFLFNYIKDRSPVDYKSAVAVMVYNFGLHEKTVKGYIKTLKDLDSIEVKGGKISVKEKKKDDKGKADEEDH